MQVRRYYFDIREGDQFASDEEGFELSTIQAVQDAAARSLADMARDAVRNRHDGAGPQMAIEFRNDDGPVLNVRFTFEVDRRKH